MEIWKKLLKRGGARDSHYKHFFFQPQEVMVLNQFEMYRYIYVYLNCR